VSLAVIGAAGQLGRQVPADVGLTRDQLDLARPETIVPALDRAQPQGVILTAAYTDVDGCESNREHAYAVNGTGPGLVARWCEGNGAWLVLVSTNCVFDGSKDGPYVEDDEPRPISVYGASKLAGEQAVKDSTNRYFIVRTSWIFGPGGSNFVTKVLQWASTQPVMKGVCDEHSSPTYAPDLGPALVALGLTGRYGTYHLANAGSCSRLEYMQAILDEAGIEKAIEPVRLADFQRPSRPPAQSALANTQAAALGIELRPWRAALHEYVRAELAGAGNRSAPGPLL